MPITRLKNNWIPREAEDKFINLLKDNSAYVLPLTGVGGAGKTSLLRRFFSHCQQHEIPALYLDLSRMTTAASASTLDMLLQVETIHTPAFEKQRKKLRTNHETLSGMLQSYGGHANNAVELLQKSSGKDESKGWIIDAVIGIIKVTYTFIQRKENHQHQQLLKKPEESLLRALAEDFQLRGVLLIDTLEQTGKQNLQTRLQFHNHDERLETSLADSPHTISLLNYCAGIAHFLMDKPVLMVLAGRPPAIRELGALPMDYFAPTIEIPAFTEAEINTYLERSLPRHLAAPLADDISKLQQLTLGNPFLLERVVRLLTDWRPIWEWKMEQWQPLFDSYQRDERHGLLLYVTRRLLTHVLPDDLAFWRLALPRKGIHREMAELLFPADEFDGQSGRHRLSAYEDKGITYREQDPDRYFLHDETRAALEAWAKRNTCWLDKTASAIHARLSVWFDQQSGWQSLKKQIDEWEKLGRPNETASRFGNPLLLEGAYHKLMADEGFERRYQEYDRPQFWTLLSASISLNNAEKMRVAAALPNLSLFQIQQLATVFKDEIGKFENLFTPTAQRWMEKQSRTGQLPADWVSNEQFLREACKRFPGEFEFVKILYGLVSPDEKEKLFLQTVEAVSKDAHNLGNFAVFMETMRMDYDRAEALYQQAMDADPDDAHNLGNFAEFMVTMRKDYDRAEALYQQAVDADPDHAHNLGNFAAFMKNIRKDYDRAEALYQQAVDADPDHARNLSSFAIFLHMYRKDYPQAKQLYHRNLEISPYEANSMTNLAQLYLLEGDKNQGRALIDQAFSTNPDEPALKLELWFYRLAHFPQDYPQAQAEIQALLESGARDEGWDLTGNIVQAEHDGHANIPLLKTLADVISKPII